MLDGKPPTAMTQEQIEVPFITDEKELYTRWEAYLTRCGYKFKKKGTNGNYIYVVKVSDLQSAFWLGSNHLALMYKLFDGPLTKTL